MGWNGELKSQLIFAGVYVYVFKYIETLTQQEKLAVGELLLKR